MAAAAFSEASSGKSAPRDLYQAVWRWHFVAGLLVLPFLVMMAVTGGIYLFKDELTHALYKPMIEVPARETPRAAISDVVRETEAATGAKVVWITIPQRPDRSIVMMIRPAEGPAQTAYADPYDAQFLGSTSYGGLMHLVRKIHSLQHFGFWASCIIELVAGWAIIMVGTGFYLWWPRGRKGGVASVRGNPGARVFWRDLHAVTGAFAGIIILFLAMTGMTWSLFWGVKMQMVVIRNQLYAPSAPGYTVQEEFLAIMDLPSAKVPPPAEKIPWTLEKMPLPQSATPPVPNEMPEMDPGEHAAHMAMAEQAAKNPSGSGAPIGVDAAVARFAELGVKRPYGLELPIGEKGIYAAYHMPQSVRGNRTMYLDQYSGASLGEMSFDDYFIGGKVIEVGNNIHMGREFGAINRYVILLGCVATVLMSISAIVMWWKRRPSGRLGLPPYPDDARGVRGFIAIIAIVGLIFPLVGLSLIAALVIDRAIVLARRPKTA